MNDIEAEQGDSVAPRKRGVLPIVAGVLLLAALVGGGVFLMKSAGNQAEAAAAEEIKSLKAVTVKDGTQKHVASLNTVTINKDSEKFNRVLELAPNLSHLQILDLANSPVTGEQLAAISGLTKLTTLQLNNTAASDDDIRNFVGMKKLVSIHLAETGLTNKGLEYVGQLSSLSNLNISNNALTDLAPLKRLTKLEWLLISQDEPFSDADVEVLAGIPSLRRLTVNAGQMTDEQATKLSSSSKQLSIDHPPSPENDTPQF